MSETSEARKTKNDAHIERLVVEIKALRPDAELDIEKYATKLTYYKVSVVASKIVICHYVKSLYIIDTAEKVVKLKYLTKAEAEAAIKEVLPEAEAKFEMCRKAYNKMEQELGFSKSYSYDGDTHGIYNEYESISFDLKGFYFEFRIED